MIAIDLGSNTLRVAQLNCTSGIFGASYEKIVKTADKLVETGIISADAIERIIFAINEAKSQIDFHNEPIKAVTTQAMRQASNSMEVLSYIKKFTDIKFEIITGDEEAKLTLLAVQYRLKQLSKSQNNSSFALIDMGGGSTELIFAYPDKVITRSFPIGIVTMTQQYGTLDTIEEVLPRLMEEMQKFRDETVATYGEVSDFVATAGTPTTVAAMKLGQTYATYNPEIINGTQLEKSELKFYLTKLLAMPLEEREVAVGVGRADLIASGILIFYQLYSLMGFESCMVIDDGLREGVAIGECSRL